MKLEGEKRHWLEEMKEYMGKGRANYFGSYQGIGRERLIER